MTATVPPESDTPVPTPAGPPGAGVRTTVAGLAPEVVVAVVVAVVAGVALRFVPSTPMWLDEALTVNIASLQPEAMLDALRSDGHPPAYYLLLHYWMDLFGTSDGAIRALSGLFSVASLPLAWLVGRRIAGPAMAWLATAMLALSPFALRYGSEARMYAMVGFGVLAGWLLVDDLWAGRRPGWRVPLLAVVTGVLMLTHYWVIFLGGAVALVAAVRWWRTTGAQRAGTAWSLVGLAGGAVLFVPWLSSFVTQAGSTGTPWAPSTLPPEAVGVLVRDLVAGPAPGAVVAVAVAGLVAAIALMGRDCGDAGRIELVVRTTPVLRTEAIVVAVALAAGTVVSWVGGTAFASRYGMVVAPVVAVALAFGVAVVRHRVFRFALLAVLLAAGLGATAQEVRGDRSQAGEWAAAIAAEARPGDVVAYCPDQLGPAGTRALTAAMGPAAGGLTEVVVPSLAGPRFVDWVDYQQRNEAADPAAVADGIIAAGGPDAAVFVVWNGSYRTYEGLCEQVLDNLRLRLPAVTDLVAPAAGEAFEHAGVIWFRR